ncbi:hypothetical protein QN277_016191 [Acacia crassicarpa]|uniref:Uncharacterized protein n=1 Tax=Acacia crassicarpa TaxID=499986 RepID=A0AAE1MW48_9FABA|nr:hypothetical protein QN277_016191 [Acacia crassicarpa]
MSEWSCEDEKRFQVALFCYPEDFPNRWEKIAEVVGFSKEIVYQRYQILQIELGQVSPPQYTNSSINNQPHKNNRKFWTLEEHALFLLGEQKYGRGHWKNISEKAVGTRNATQVASHAQKFYIRQREKETIVHSRGSIHDFTLANYPPEYLKYLLSSRPHLMPGSCRIMQQPNTSIHRHLALHNDNHSLPVTQLGTHIPSTLYQSHQDALPTHYDHLVIEGKAEDLSSIRGNTHPGVSDEVMDEKDMNVNNICDNEQGNTIAGSSPSQREDLKSGNTRRY